MTTKLTMYYYYPGAGDTQAAEQFTAAFNHYVAVDDPGWGDVVIAAGVHGAVMTPHKGDINLYWWWSGSDNENWLEYYHSVVSFKPSAILCTSRKMYDHAKKRGYKAIYLPIGFGPEFKPLSLPRKGTGYCGTPHHKSTVQEAAIIEPAKGFGFTWRVQIPGGRTELNEWYNSLVVCLGMTADITLSWGIVPSRTYEVLATATPYITYKHWSMCDELGFDYPYQSDNASTTEDMIIELMYQYRYHQTEFELYASLMRRYHTWDKRVEQLAEGLNGI